MKIKGLKKLVEVLSDPATWNRWRIQGKIMLSRLAYSLVALFAIDTMIAAITKTLLHPAIAIAGLIWIISVTLIIWRKGGVAIDALFGAEIINLEIPHEGKKFRLGHEFMQAIALLGMIGIFITSFFLVVPIWQSWSLFLTLLIMLIGWRCAATLAESKFNWNNVRIVYIVFCAAGLGSIFLITGHEFITGQPLTAQAIRTTLQAGGLGKLIFWPILLIIVGMIPKVPLRGLIKAAGIISLLIILFVTFAWPTAKKELTAMQKEYGSSKAHAALPPKKEPITELACATVVVPAGEIVNTHFFVRAGQRIWFSQEGHPKRYYIHGDIVEIPVVEKEFTCTFSTSDYIYLRGGPITTTITLNRG